MYADEQIQGPLDSGLQLADEAAVVATGYSTVVDLGEGWSPSPITPMGMNLNVTALDTGDGDETYAVEVEESSDAVTYTSTGLSFSVLSARNFFKIFGSMKRYVRLKYTEAGTSPSMTLSGWVVPIG